MVMYGLHASSLMAAPSPRPVWRWACDVQALLGNKWMAVPWACGVCRHEAVAQRPLFALTVLLTFYRPEQQAIVALGDLVYVGHCA